MYVCMCVCVCVCERECVCACSCVCVSVRMRVCACRYIYVGMCACVCLYVGVRVRARVSGKRGKGCIYASTTIVYTRLEPLYIPAYNHVEMSLFPIHANSSALFVSLSLHPSLFPPCCQFQKVRGVRGKCSCWCSQAADESDYKNHVD